MTDTGGRFDLEKKTRRKIMPKIGVSRVMAMNPKTKSSNIPPIKIHQEAIKVANDASTETIINHNGNLNIEGIFSTRLIKTLGIVLNSLTRNSEIIMINLKIKIRENNMQLVCKLNGLNKTI